MSVVVVGAGSNLGARESAIFASAALLASRPGIDVVEVSSLYETPPLGPPQDDYLNAAFRLETTLTPPVLLHTLLRIERRLGRRRRADLRWGPRSIDLDLLWDSRGPFDSEELHVPHRELDRRNFVLGPLLDVVPELDDTYGASLEREGGRPTLWNGAPVVQETSSASAFERVVESTSLVDACASSVRLPLDRVRPWATHHVTLPASFDAYAEAVRRLCRAGFQCCCTTISHCSQSQWNVEFHGAATGLTRDVDVRLETTSADLGEVRVTFVAKRPHSK